ncbi:MAG: 1-acyl-sn-glycerol-3-phosphate acyltransferase [Candidatus Paceibacterota bacterium]
MSSKIGNPNLDDLRRKTDFNNLDTSELELDTIGKIKEALKLRFSREIHSMVEFSAFYQEFLEKIHVSLKSAQEHSVNFKTDRLKLNSEAGVIIANHPSVFDTSAILSLLSRNDVLVMADEADFWEGTVVEENFIRTPKPFEVIKVFERIREHIKKGGVFLIFPTGGRENSGEEFKFKRGFRYMLENGILTPETMVYAFNIQGGGLTIPEEEKQDYKNKCLLYFAQQVLEDSRVVIEKPAHLEIVLDERYTKAQEWASLLGSNKGKEDIALTKHYTDLFLAK